MGITEIEKTHTRNSGIIAGNRQFGQTVTFSFKMWRPYQKHSRTLNAKKLFTQKLLLLTRIAMGKLE